MTYHIKMVARLQVKKNYTVLELQSVHICKNHINWHSNTQNKMLTEQQLARTVKTQIIQL